MEFEAHPEMEQWRFRCRRCRQKKDGSQMLRVDVSQQFKALSPGRIAVATRRLGKRLKARWKCRAVKHGKDARGKPKMTVVKRVYRKKGKRVWSFGSRDKDIEKTVAWIGSHTLTRFGKALLRRKRGVPMGSSISPEKANTALGEAERQAYAVVEGARRRKFIRQGERPEDVVRGRRLADDITLAECCVLNVCMLGRKKYIGDWCLKWKKKEDERRCAIEDRRSSSKRT